MRFDWNVFLQPPQLEKLWPLRDCYDSDEVLTQSSRCLTHDHDDQHRVARMQRSGIRELC